MNSIYKCKLICYNVPKKPVDSFYELVLSMSEVIPERLSTLACTQAIHTFRVEECRVPLASQKPH